MSRRIDGSLVVTLCAFAALLAALPGLLTGRLLFVEVCAVTVMAALGLVAEAVLGASATVGHMSVAGSLAGVAALPAAVGLYYVLEPVATASALRLDEWSGSALLALTGLGPFALPMGLLAGWLGWHRRQDSLGVAERGRPQPAPTAGS